MDLIWAKRLIDTKKPRTWAEVPYERKSAVAAILLEWVESGKITDEQYHDIVGIGI